MGANCLEVHYLEQRRTTGRLSLQPGDVIMATDREGLARRFVFVSMFLILSANAPEILAQTQDANEPEDFFEMSIEDLMELEIATASKYKQKISEAPSSVTVVTAEEIRKYGYRTVLDILNSVPGFYKTYDRNYGYIGVRGFGRPGDYNSRILLLVDGHRANDNLGGSLGVVTDFHIDVDLIERIEIVRGPGSALYGSNAHFRRNQCHHQERKTL